MTVFEDYVNMYSDLLSTFRNSINWEGYVDSYSDLINAWNALTPEEQNSYNVNRGSFPSGRALWGAEHYRDSGEAEGRRYPLDSPGGGFVYNKDQWGAAHWDSAGSGEARILPGEKLGIRANGNIFISNPDLIGSGLTQRYNNLIALANNARSGGYKNMIESIDGRNGLGDNRILVQDFIANDGLDLFNASYLEKNINPWDPVVSGAQPPTGAFNANYYRRETEGGEDARRDWNNARRAVSLGGVRMPDLDITATYDSLDNYMHWHYTTQGKAEGYRGNAPIPEDETEYGTFKEVLTDYEKQLYRDQVLGITTDESGKQKIVLATPEYDEEGNLINAEELDTTLEQEFGRILSSQDYQKEKQLGALSQDLLKVSIQELKQAKREEANLGLMKGLPGYNDIVNINSTLANSIIGDTGIGGILGLTGGKKQFQDTVEKGLGEITGISSNSTIYNWQKWFDETLVKRYEEYELEAREFGEEELQVLQAAAQEEVKQYEEDQTLPKPIYLEIAEKYKEGDKILDINNAEDFKKIMFHIDMENQREFVNSFIDGYLKPRFDQSKSMDEFLSYLDVKESEQNVFQSQTTINKLKEIADLRAKSFLDLLSTAESTSANFDANFYVDPIANNTKDVGAEKMAQYELQRDLVASDFENAKNGVVGEDGIDWAIEAYRYGFEGTYTDNIANFARLHYQAKGSTGAVTDSEGKPFILDPAQDILPYQELENKIKNFGVEMAARREFYGGAGFMKFVTPEEYADAVLGSVDPTKDKESWEEILKAMGLEGTDASIEEVKKYLIEQLRTEEAKSIRENIKYLNETQSKINQQTLGVSYIERPEDVKEVEPENPTVLYTFFKDAGYGGTEDDFYNEFFPDIDRTEQEVISNVSNQRPFESVFSDVTDPFKAFTSVSRLLADEEEPVTTNIFDGGFTKKEEEVETPEPSYFRLFESDDEELPEKSEAASSFLKGFTSMFKGFN